MVKTRKSGLGLSLLVIAIGIAWMMNELGMIPGVNWIWTVSLGVSGILLLALAELDRFNFVVGTSLIVCSVLSILRGLDKLPVKIEAPFLVIIVGLLSLFSHFLPIKKDSGAPEIQLDPPIGTSTEERK